MPGPSGRLFHRAGRPAEYKPPETTEAATAQTQQDTRAQSFGLSYQPDAGWNPYICTRLANRPLISLLYQGLFSVSSQYRAEPVLCQRYSVASDLKAYRFYLAEATFSDGSALTAQDVVASLEAAKGSAVYGNRLSHVTGIRAEGTDCVAISLDTAYENLPLLLDIPIVRASDVASAQPLGTGAYAVAARRRRIDPPSGLVERLPAGRRCANHCPVPNHNSGRNSGSI